MSDGMYESDVDISPRKKRNKTQGKTWNRIRKRKAETTIRQQNQKASTKRNRIRQVVQTLFYNSKWIQHLRAQMRQCEQNAERQIGNYYATCRKKSNTYRSLGNTTHTCDCNRAPVYLYSSVPETGSTQPLLNGIAGGENYDDMGTFIRYTSSSKGE